MGTWVLFSILTVVLLLIHIFMCKVYSDNMKIVYKRGTGVVSSLYHEKGYTYYYVILEDDGKNVEGRTDPYYGIKNKYHDRDQVEISYAYSKAGKVMVKIEDTELSSPVGGCEKPSNSCLYMSMACLVIALIMFICKI